MASKPGPARTAFRTRAGDTAPVPEGLDSQTLAWRLAVSVAIGLLVGIDRERRKGEGPGRDEAGVRTFAVVGGLGGVAGALGDEWAIAVAAVAALALAVAGYLRHTGEDPGITTEAALVLVALLGALAIREPAVAAGGGVVLAILLASRSALHRFVRNVLREDELHDLLLFAAAAVVVLPLLPREAIGPYDVVKPFTIWRLAVVVMGISGVGYVLLRMLGPGRGLPIAGLAGGFVSSTATIGSMGALAKATPALRRPALAGALLSTVATFIQMGLILGTTSGELVRRMAPSLAAGGLIALVVALAGAARALRDGGNPAKARRPFQLSSAVLFALTVTAVLLVAAALNDLLGERGAVLSAGLAGLADTHAAGASVAVLVGRGEISVGAGALAVAIAMTTNSASKAVVAFTQGGRSFGWRIGVGLVLVLVGLWGGVVAAELGWLE